jgi:hypothetical protein
MNRLYIGLASLFLMIACRKDVRVAHTDPAAVAGSAKTATTPAIPAATMTTVANSDTLADRTQLKLALLSDSLHADETVLLFVKTADPCYNGNEDARYFQGLGLENLASLAPDGTELAINSMPYMPGKPIGLYVYGKNDGPYLLKISYETKIPDNLRVWIKDNLTRDSLDLRTGNYRFNLLKTDTNTYGSKRFWVVLRANR